MNIMLGLLMGFDLVARLASSWRVLWTVRTVAAEICSIVANTLVPCFVLVCC